MVSNHEQLHQSALETEKNDLIQANNLTLSRFMMVNLYLMEGLVF